MDSRTQDIDLTQKEIDTAWGNANFGPMSKHHVIRYGLLKVACGYHQGRTAISILQELNLITPEYELTPRGRMNLYELFRNGTNL